ncbi:MAG: hypothetical protein U0Y10_16800 [Spirosomataceae bacterium]
MQLSLVSELPEFDKKIFLDIFAEVYYDSRRNRLRLKTIEGQRVPAHLMVGCEACAIAKFPEGTIYKLDARLVKKQGKKPYFVAIKQKKVERAIEFFEHNLKLQQRVPLPPTAKIRVAPLRRKQKKYDEFAPF